MKKTFLISLLALCTLSLNAQTVKENMTDEEYSERLLWLKGCFEKLSRPEPHKETYTLSTGKTIELKAQSDYKRSAFVSADQLLQDLREWRQSPYTWQLRHRKNNQAIMDGRDLSNWEINSFDQISQAYFKDCQSTYHIAAHGLLSQDGVVGDGIMIDGQILNAAETAELIIKSMYDQFHDIIAEEKQPFTVVVHSCNVAQGENNFAAQLSKILSESIPNVAVVGAPDVVYCQIQDGKYTEYVSTPSTIQTNNPVKQKWHVYRNGRNTGEGRYDYRETVQAIQKPKE